MKFNLFLLALIILPLECERANYTNPVIKVESPDPFVIKGHDNYYYLFTSDEKIYRSRDLVNWNFHGKAFENTTSRPSFINTGNTYWNPCITKQNSSYILYFSLSNGGNDNGIGVATSSNPGGPFNIMNGNGKLFINKEIDVDKSINPRYIEDAGNKYIIFGYKNGIYGIELSSNGTSVKNIKNKFKLAGDVFELPFIYKRNNYYYLFASIGECCLKKLSNNNQQIVFGRADTFKGPYMSQNKGDMLNNAYEVLIGKNNIYYSAGSISIINDTEKTWIIYHAIIIGNGTYNGTRYSCIDELKWDSDDWPYIDGNSPSNERKVGPIILTDADTSLEKSNILTDVDTSFEKSNILSDIDTSFEKSNILSDIDTSFEKSNILTNDDTSFESIYKDDINQSKYIYNNNTSSSKIMNISEYIQYLIECTYSNYSYYNVTNGQDLEIEVGENILFTLTTTDNQKNKDYINKTTINLGECEKSLKKENDIQLNNSLYMIKIDIKEEGMKIPKIEYIICYPLDNDKLIPLNLSVCQNTNINISIPVKISKDINKYNINSNYYNDICSKATSNSKTDITLSDRKNEFIYENMTLCEENCDLIEYNYTIEKAKCSCNIKKSMTPLIETVKFDKKKLLKNIADITNIINIKVVKCYKSVFIGKNLVKNYGFFIFIVILILYFVTLFLFSFKYYFSLKKEIQNITEAKIIIFKPEKKGSKGFDINIRKINKKSKTRSKRESSKKINIKKDKKDIYMYPPSKNKKKGKNNQNLYINSNILIMPVASKSKSFVSNRDILPFSMNKKQLENKYIKIMKYTNNELNLLTYEEALIYDKRTFFEFYKSLLIGGHLFLFSFYINSRDYNSKIIKMFLFFFHFSIYFTVNALFFNDDTIHEIYIDEGTYNFLYQLSQIIYSTLISAVINIFIKFLSLSDRNISVLKLEKGIKNIKTKFNGLIRTLKIKFIFFFVVSFIILLLCMFYISCFCGIYVNSQSHLIIDTIISFIISLIYPFGLYLIPGMFRIPALRAKIKNKHYIYNISKFIKILI